MRAKILLATLFLLAGQAFGQFIQITGTVQDNIGLPYAFGSITPVLNISGSPTLNGQAYTPPQQPFGLDSNGKFAFNLAANNQLSPSGSTWSFIICSGPGTVSIAWGRQSECFNVNTLTLNTAQDITRQIMTQSQPLTYSSSVLLAANPSSCPILDGLVDFNFSVRDASGRASVQVAALGSQSAIGFAVFVPGAQCRGVVQVATGLVVPCKSDGQTVIGDFVTSSSTVAGECNDYGSVLSSTTKTYGQVIAANNGAGTVSMIFISGTAGGGGGGGGTVGNCPVNGGVGWYQFAGNIIGCNVNLIADSLGNLTALSYTIGGTGTLEITSTTYNTGLPPVCAAGSTCLSFDTNGILNGSVNTGAWFSYLTSSNINCTQPFLCVGSATANSVVSSTVTDDLVNPVRSRHGHDVATLGYYAAEVPANTTTGVGQYLTGCDDGAGKLLVCPHATSTTNVPAGIVEACNDGATPPNWISCATSGNAVVSGYGFLKVFFDNTATPLDYAQQSSTVDGELHDVGATPPTNGQPYYHIWIGNAGAGTTGVIRILIGDELLATGGGGPPNRIQVNGTNSARTSNFVDTASVTWSISTSGNTSTIRATAVSGLAVLTVPTPPAPTLTTNGSAGTTSISYCVVARQDSSNVAGTYHTPCSATATINTANATLSNTNSVNLKSYFLTTQAASVRCYDIYRTATNGTSPTTTGLLAACTDPASFIDTGLAGDGTTPPVTNTTQVFAHPQPQPACNQAFGGVFGIDAPNCAEDAFTDEFAYIFQIAGVNSPHWTWVNQGSSTATLSNGMMEIQAGDHAGADSISCLSFAAPSTPYAFTTLVYSTVGNATTDQVREEFGWTDGTKFLTVGATFVSNTTNPGQINTLQWTNTTTIGTVLGSTPIVTAIPTGYYFRIQNDGTNLKTYYSPDGIFFYLDNSQTITNFLANANEVVMCIDSLTGANQIDFDYFRKTQ